MQHLLNEQAGVVSRRQLIDGGMDDNDVRRMVRRRELSTVHPGVFVNHTGELTWLRRAWAAVLYAWPAALVSDSALRAADGPGRERGRESQIHVGVAHGRKVVARPGLLIERRRALDTSVLWNLGPPRVRYEDAVLLSARSQVPRRGWIAAVLRDVAEGTCSVLEHGYLTHVERPHGLPRARRQLRAVAVGGPIYRDAELIGRVLIELDGRLFHDTATARDRDLERDLDASLEERSTVRLGWGQVFDRPCSTASKIGRLLVLHGWTGHIHPCGPSCSSLG